MAFQIDVKLLHNAKHKKKTIDINILQNGKNFYRVVHAWENLKDENEERFNQTLAPLLSMFDMKNDRGSIGPITEEQMIAFEIGMTKVSKVMNQWAVEDCKEKGRDYVLAQEALATV